MRIVDGNTSVIEMNKIDIIKLVRAAVRTLKNDDNLISCKRFSDQYLLRECNPELASAVAILKHYTAPQEDGPKENWQIRPSQMRFMLGF